MTGETWLPNIDSVMTRASLVCEMNPPGGVRYCDSICCAIWTPEPPQYDRPG